MNSIKPNRAEVERLVREALAGKLAPCPAGGSPPSELKVNVSARHMHISQANLEVLFGPGHKL